MILSIIGFGILLSIGAGAAIVTKGIRFFIKCLFAVLTSAPLLLLIKKIVIEQIFPENIWIYCIPAGIYMIVSVIYRVYIGWFEGCRYQRKH